MSFGAKWNVRDVLRHKARSAMTLVGVFGCMLLIIGGLGMRDTMTLEEVRKLAEDSDKYPIHYYMHACHACEIIGFKHPDNEIKKWFNSAYLIMVDALHLKPETEEECDYRLRDGVNTPFTEIDEEN